MGLLSYVIYFYIVFLLISLSAVLIFKHLNFMVTCLEERRPFKNLRYIEFFKSAWKRRTKLIVFVFVPLGLTFGIIVPFSLIGPYNGSVLRKELQDSSLLKIRTGGICHREPDREVELYETNDNREIRRLLEQLSFKPAMNGMCECCGDMTFEFYKGDKNVGTFSLHHDTHIRIQNKSSGDIFLSERSCRLLDNWLTEKGIRKIQKELEVR